MLKGVTQRILLPATMTMMLIAFGERVGSVARAASDLPPVRDAAPAVSPSATAPKIIEEPKKDSGGLTCIDLQERKADLQKWSTELDQRSELIAAAESKLQKRLEQLQKLQATLEEASRARDARMSANWSGLVKTYESMKPEDAAGIFNVLDNDVLIEVLDRMDARKEASVLAAMVPERARQATQMLAHKRTRENGVGAALPGGG